MSDFTVNGVAYKAMRLSAMQAFHVGRRILPILPQILNATKDGASTAAALVSAADFLAGLSDESAEYIIKACLMVCEREQTGGWARLTTQAGDLMFQDIDLSAMLQIVGHVLRDNLSDFTAALPLPSAPEGSPVSSQ